MARPIQPIWQLIFALSSAALKKTPLDFFFFHNFLIYIPRRYEKWCQILVRIFCHIIGSDSYCVLVLSKHVTFVFKGLIVGVLVQTPTDENFFNRSHTIKWNNPWSELWVPLTHYPLEALVISLNFILSKSSYIFEF